MLCLGATKEEWIVLRDRETKKVLAQLTLANGDKADVAHIAIDAPMDVEIYREPQTNRIKTAGAAV